MDEYKELYLEEILLLKKILKYGTEHQRKDLGRIEKVKMLLLHRIYSILFSSLFLTVRALKTGKISLYQLPIGILLRCCYTDCIFALYILRVDLGQANEELDLRTIEYANSLLERREVYRDQVKSTGVEFDDVCIDHMWELTLEDNFMGLLTIEEGMDDLVMTKPSKEQLKKAGFSKAKSLGTKDQIDFLLKIPELNVVATRLYHYYKYFSQYEHFSENAQGDVLVSAEEDGNDNIHLPSAIRALSAGVEELMMDSVNK